MEIAVQATDLRGAPPIMPAHVELPDVSAEDAFAMRLLARDGDLWVRVAGEAARRQVTGIWTDPHNAARLTLFF
ncbi:MAG TPA: hypothetical protein VNM16_12770 [Bacillota bacterium]|nr:hypothetical protein [Bacillota bacterium]